MGLFNSLGLCVVNETHPCVFATDSVIDSQDAFEIDLDPSLFLTLSKSCCFESLAVVDGASRYPPTTIPGLIDSEVFAVVRRLFERVPNNQQGEANHFKHSPLRHSLLFHLFFIRKVSHSEFSCYKIAIHAAGFWGFGEIGRAHV